MDNLIMVFRKRNSYFNRELIIFHGKSRKISVKNLLFSWLKHSINC